MRKLFKLFILVITCVFVFSLTSCAKGSFADAELVDVAGIVVDVPVEGKTFVGYYSFNEDKKTGTLYLVGAEIPTGKYEPVYVDGTTENYSLPEHGHQRDGYYFAGWYKSAEFKHGERVTTFNTVDNDLIVCAKYITLADAGLISVICVAIVFLMLILLCFIVKTFKYASANKEDEKPEVKNEVPAAPVVREPQKAFTMNDIKDEDMMVAALIATIDYHNETNEDVRVVSVKQIG